MIASTFHSFALQLPTVLAHFLWQGAAIGLIAVVVNFMMQERHVQWRYRINLMLLASFLLCIPATFWSLSKSGTIEYAGIEEQPISAVQSAAVTSKATPSESLDQNPIPTNSNQEQQDIVWPSRSWDDTVRIGVTLVYLIGVMLMLARTARAAWQVHRLSRAGKSEVPEWLKACLAKQAKRIGIAVAPAIRVCQDVSVPVVVGLLRPMILVPVSILSNLKHDEIESILIHELAHIRRNDLWFNLLQRLVEAMLFFHPAVWYVSRQVSRCREVCCDETVLTQGCDRLQYASALINMAGLAMKSGVRESLNEQMSLAAGRVSNTDFNRRVCRLLGMTGTARGFAREGLLLSVTAASVFSLCIAITSSQTVQAQEPEEYTTTAQKLDFLRKMVDAQRSNFAKMHTWKATYEYEFRFLREDEDTKTRHRNVKTGELTFSVDFDKHLLRSYQNPVGGIVIEDVSGKKLEKPDIPPELRGLYAPNVEFIVSEAEVIHYDHQSHFQRPGDMERKIKGLPRNGVSEVRLYKNTNDNNPLVMASCFNPMEFFNAGGGREDFTYQSYDRVLSNISNSPEGEIDEWTKQLNIHFDNETWVMESASKEKDKVWRKIVFDSKLESWLEYSWGVNDRFEQKIEASYTRSNGVSIPSNFVEIRYHEGQESSRWTYKLTASEMNPSFSAEDFTIAAFKLPNGTRMVDFREQELPKLGHAFTLPADRNKKREEASKSYFETTKMLLDGSWLSIDEYNAKVPD